MTPGNAGKTEEQAEKERRAEARAKKRTAEFEESLKAPRPGVRRTPPEELEARDVSISGSRIELSPVQWIDPEKLGENPYNDYPPLAEEELEELAGDIAEKGLLVPLILRLSDNTIICGHNRTRAAIHAKERKVPVQRVLRDLTEEEERELMKSENDRRRGGNWSREKKEEFIREHFGERLETISHGGNRKKRGQDSLNLEKSEQGTTVETQNQDSMNLAQEVEKKSRGKITKGTAQRIIADMRKSGKKTAGKAARPQEDSGPSTLSEKDRKRGEKLALHLKTLRATREKLEGKLKSVKEDEKKTLKELKSIGQPELFGVES